MKDVIVTPAFSHFPGDWHLSPGLDTGDFVFFSGVTGTGPDLTLADDPETQFRDTFRFLQANLEQASLGFGDVVEMTTYHGVCGSIPAPNAIFSISYSPSPRFTISQVTAE